MQPSDQYIITASGKRFYFNDPKPEQVCIEDIAHALSVMPRFSGHTKQFYSVAQHCVEVSKLVEAMTISDCRGDPETGMVNARTTERRVRHASLRGLLHDAHEAYVGDMSTPLKDCLPEFKVIETKAENAVFYAFLLTEAFQQFSAHIQDACAAVKKADLTMLATERRDLMPATSDRWAVLDGVQPRKEFVHALCPTKAKAAFLARFKELTKPHVDKQVFASAPVTEQAVWRAMVEFPDFPPSQNKRFRDLYEGKWEVREEPAAARQKLLEQVADLRSENDALRAHSEQQLKEGSMLKETIRRLREVIAEQQKREDAMRGQITVLIDMNAELRRAARRAP